MSAPTSSNELNDYTTAVIAATDQIIFSDASDSDEIKRTSASGLQTPWLQNINGAGFQLSNTVLQSDVTGNTGITGLGTITTGVWNGTDIALGNIANGTSNQIIKTNAGGTALEFGLIGDANTATFTTTKISTTNKSLLNSAIVYNDQANSFGDFLQTFKDNQLKINSPDDTDGTTLVNSNQTTNRNLTIPVLTANRDIVVTGESSQITIGTEVTGTSLNLTDTANIAYLNTPNVYFAGNKQSFVASATLAGLNINNQVPSNTTGGDLWRTVDALTYRNNADSSDLVIATTSDISGKFDTAGTGLTSSGTTVNAIGTASRISVSADAIDIDSAYVGQSTITTLGTITTGVWNGTAITGANINAASTDLTDTASIAYLNTANSYIAGTRQDFLGLLAGTAGLNVGGIAGNPTTQVNGDIWLNTSSNTLFGRINGADVDLGGSGGGEVFTWTADHSAATFDLNNAGVIYFVQPAVTGTDNLAIFATSSTVLKVNLPNNGHFTISESLVDHYDFEDGQVDFHDNNIVNLGGGTITDLTTVTAVTGDFVLISDTSDSGNLKKVNASDFLGGGSGTLAGLTDVTLTSQAIGDILLADSTSTWINLAAATSGFVLTSNGAGTQPTWQAVAGSGDMILAAVQTVTGAKTFGTIGGAVDKFILAGSTSGSTIVNAAAVAGSTTMTFPGTSGTVVITGLASQITIGTEVTGASTALTDTANIAYLNTTNSYIAGTRQDFLGLLAGTSGLNVGGIAGNPTTQVNGDIWLNTSSNTLFGRINGADVDLGASGGGSQTPWLSDIDAANNSLSNLDILEFGENVDTPTITNAEIYWAAASGMSFNIPTGDNWQFKIAGTAVYTFDNDTLNMGDNSLTNVNGIAMANSGTDVIQWNTNQSIAVSAGNMSINVASGGLQHFVIDSTLEYSFSATQANFQGNDLIGVNDLAIAVNGRFSFGALGANPALAGDGADFTMELDASAQFEIQIGGAGIFLVEDAAITLSNNINLILSNDNTSFNGYIQMEEIPSGQADPTPGTGQGIWYTREVDGVAKPYFIGDGQVAIDLSSDIVTINFVIDGGGSTITTGIKGHLVVDFNCTVTEWAIVNDQSGAIVVDVNRATFANYPTTASIAGTELPTITAASRKGEDRTLTTWSTIVAGDILEFEVDSVTSSQRVTVALKVIKTQ